MTRVLDKPGTIAMLASLKDGDHPLERGDEFFHPSYGPMTVSRVLGWSDMLHFEGSDLIPERAFRVTAVRVGRKKAETVPFLLPRKSPSEVAPR